MGPAALLLMQAARPFLAPSRPGAEPRRCPVERTDEVVVCATDQSRFRLGPPPRPDRDGPALPDAKVRVGRGSVSAETEAYGVGGHPSNRIMMRLKLPF